MKAVLRAFLLQPMGRSRQAGGKVIAALALLLTIGSNAGAAGPTVLYTFTAPSVPLSSPGTNRDGASPESRMVLGMDGKLYGTTSHGGSNGAGSFFCMTTAGTFSNLYSFTPATNNSRQTNFDLGPNDLIQEANGNFYGTTQHGGANLTGSAFEVSTNGTFTLLHSFAAQFLDGNADGITPVGALVRGTDGNFYGATASGGAGGTGTIFEITSSGGFISLYSFPSASSGSGNAHGAIPNPLRLGNDGAFYGTTQQGGPINNGTFFKFTVANGLTQIFSFTNQVPGNNPLNPNSPLVEDGTGNFYGSSAYGGLQGGGCVFEVTNIAASGANRMTVLYSFPLLNAGLNTTLTLGADGNLYGTTAAAGLNGSGTLFRLTPAGAFGSYSFSALNSLLNNADGANPLAALTSDGAGNLYGSCAEGGTNGSGLLFQIFSPNFIPPFFEPSVGLPPPRTNVLVGSSVAFSYLGDGLAPLSYRWVRNKTNFLVDGGDISGAATGTLLIDPVFSRDVGTYTLVISNAWGPLASPQTVLTITPPGVTIVSPKANAATPSKLFSGTATNAPLFAGADPSLNRLTTLIYTFSNLFSGSNISGTGTITGGTGGVSDWSFMATPFPGTNILSVQSEDVSGDISPVVSRTFFYEGKAQLEVLITGSGTGTFNLTNNSMLNLGEGYAITARPRSSVFSYWSMGGTIVSYDRTYQFLMQSNTVLTANFMARPIPSLVITSPKPNSRSTAPVFTGTAKSSPLLPGVDATNVAITNVVYWLTNDLTQTFQKGAATLTSAGALSNWSIKVTPLPGTNTLAVQCEDQSGGLSAIESRKFFYEVQAPLTLTNAGNGLGAFIGSAFVAGDTVPANGAMLNIGESYKVTAIPGRFSFFTNWMTTNGNVYSKTVSFIMQSNLSLTGTFLEIPPVVSISSPAMNSRTTAPVFEGTASGHFPLTNVLWSLANTNGAVSFTAGNGAVSNWSFNLVSPPGSNTLTVRSVDVNGNQSKAVSHKFFCVVPAQLTVKTAGQGSGTFSGAASGDGSGPGDGAMLNIGEGYRITALPDKSSLFSNWVGTVDDIVVISNDSPALSFVMQSNLVLTATFATNIFPPLAGTYNGLFFPTNGITETTSGMLYNLVLGKTGTFDAKLLMAGTNYHIATNFNAGGTAAFALGRLQVSLNLSMSNATPIITGTVLTQSSQLVGVLKAGLGSGVLPSAEYTILLSPSTNALTIVPPGQGYVLVTNRAGVVTLSGALADGTRYSQNATVSETGDVPVYASLYGNSSPGLLMGWINLTNLQAPTNVLTWIRKASTAATSFLYPQGFTDILRLQGAPWTNAEPGTPAVPIMGGQLSISNADLFLSFTNVIVSDNNKLANAAAAPTNSLTGSVNAKTGLLTVRFGNGNGRATDEGFGTILQGTSNAGGFFITLSNNGSFNLRP